MKNKLFSFIIFILLFALIGCSTAPTQNTNNTTTEAINTTDTAPTVATEENQSATTTANTENRNFITGSAIQYRFSSIEDMHTYLTTGSTNLNDYRYAPHYPLNQTPSPEVFLSRGYMPISDILDIDESLFDEVYASFRFNDNGSVTYLYELDRVRISIKRSSAKPGETISQYYARKHNITLTNDSTATLNPEITIAENLLVRKCGNYEILYDTQIGFKQIAIFLINDYEIAINFNGSSTQKTAAQDYYSFINAEKNAVLIPFFTDDQQTFETAVAAMLNHVATSSTERADFIQ